MTHLRLKALAATLLVALFASSAGAAGKNQLFFKLPNGVHVGNGNTNPGTGNPGTGNPGTGNPGTENPGPVDPGPVDPGPVDPGPVEPDVPPHMVIAGEFDFGRVPMGMETVKLMPVLSEGTKGGINFAYEPEVEGTGLRFGGANNSCFYVIPVGQGCELPIAANPRKEGPFTGVMRVSVLGMEEPSIVQIKGEAFNPFMFSAQTPVVVNRGVAIPELDLKKFLMLETEPGATFDAATWTVIPSLPAGITLNAATGLVQGKAQQPLAAPVSHTVTVKYKGNTASQPLSIDVKGVLLQVKSVASGGGGHVCAVTIANEVKCWGNNSSGQLGDGTTTASQYPVAVKGLPAGISQVAVGANASCAVAPNGVYCWGSNTMSMLGSGTAGSAVNVTPQLVTGVGAGVRQLVMSTHACVLNAAGGVQCWGFTNGKPNLGDGGTTTRNYAVNVSGLGSGVRQISVGLYTSCALTNGGAVFCWGAGGYGQLGGGKSDAYTPRQVTGLPADIRQVSAGGSHSCAVTSGNQLYCWGYNNVGQLGDGTTTDRAAPTYISAMGSNVRTVHAATSAGANETCAETLVGGVKCWGSLSSMDLGDGTEGPGKVSLPVDTVFTTGVTAFHKSDELMCAILGTNLKCWGNNLNQTAGGLPGEWFARPKDMIE